MEQSDVDTSLSQDNQVLCHLCVSKTESVLRQLMIAKQFKYVKATSIA